MSIDAAANAIPVQSGLSNEVRHRAALKAWHRLTIVVLLMMAAPVFGSVLVGLRLHHTRHAPSPIIPRPDTAFVSIHAKLQSVALKLQITQTQQAIHQLHAAETKWTKLVDATLHDDRGKRIAGTEETLLQFLALQQMQPPPQQNRDFSNRLAEIESKPDLPQEGRPSRQLASQATELKQDVLALLTFHQGRLTALNDLRHDAAQRPLADSELKEVLQTRNSQLESHRQSLAMAAAAELSNVMQRDLDELEIQQAEVAALVSDLQAQYTLVERGEQPAPATPTIPVQEPAAREEYRKELNDIRATLKPFITPGYAQPDSTGQLVSEQVKRPVSYSALQKIRALEDTDAGRAILLRIGGSKSATQQNDRPLGRFPRMNSLTELENPDVKSRLQEAQRLLRTYGQLMVEDGLLAP